MQNLLVVSLLLVVIKCTSYRIIKNYFNGCLRVVIDSAQIKLDRLFVAEKVILLLPSKNKQIVWITIILKVSILLAP